MSRRGELNVQVRQDRDVGHRLQPQPNGGRRHGGWFGIAFLLLLFIEAAMVTLPTGSRSGEYVRAFYAAHGQLILLQQVVGAMALIPLVGFAWALGARRNPLLLVGAALVLVSELATNAIPAGIILGHPAAGAAHTLTVFEDLADAALFISIGLFSVAATFWRGGVLRVGGLIVATLVGARAVLSRFGVDGLDFIAPLAFIVLVLVLSIQQLRAKQSP